MGWLLQITSATCISIARLLSGCAGFTDNDVGTRQTLPGWISGPIEREVAKWVEEHHKWISKIDARCAEGKELTPSIKVQYDRWCSDSKEKQLLFSKKTCSLAGRIRKNANQERLRRELFSLVIFMSSDPTELLVQAGSGEARRLVLLEGMPQSPNLPDFIDQGLAEGAIAAALEQGKHEQEEDRDEGDVELEGWIDEQNAIMEQDALCDGGSDLEEILAFSDEEEGLAEVIPSGKYVAVKSFHHRPVFKSLEEKGLTHLPQGGVHISYHKTSRTWSGYYPGRESSGLCYTHGGKTKRTEGEALVKAIKGVLSAHLEKYPRDRMWRAQYDKVVKYEATCASL
ncbi:unnamed protein product [Durusdinium trenchii]|uniref:Uncharacterized protein n=1 Tax=Durusdinium trenchii TaxID=1381693 RepID=A0ABP0SSS6_9DINO